MILPIYTPGHWACAMFLTKNNVHNVYYFDSANRGPVNPTVANNLIAFAKVIWPGFDKKVVYDFGPRMPRQTNGIDCGVFALEFLIRAYMNPKKFMKAMKNKASNAPIFSTALITSRRLQYR